MTSDEAAHEIVKYFEGRNFDLIPVKEHIEKAVKHYRDLFDSLCLAGGKSVVMQIEGHPAHRVSFVFTNLDDAHDFANAIAAIGKFCKAKGQA